MLFSEAIVKFNTWQSFNSKRKPTLVHYGSVLRNFALYLHNIDIEEVNLESVLNYLKDMREIGFNENEFRGKCNALRKFFEFFGKLKVTTFDYQLIPLPEREYKLPKIAKLEDYFKVLNSIPDINHIQHVRNRAILMLFKDSGMRLGELLSLNVKDLDLEKMEALIKTEKTKTLHPIRKIFWTDDTNDQLKKWLKIRNSKAEALFISVNGNNVGGKLKRNAVTDMLRQASKRAGLAYTLNSHSLRHLFGHDLARNNVTGSSIATMLGHANQASSYVYTMLHESEMSNVYRAMREAK
jgi:integrase/recombinase XerC